MRCKSGNFTVTFPRPVPCPERGLSPTHLATTRGAFSLWQVSEHRTPASASSGQDTPHTVPQAPSQHSHASLAGTPEVRQPLGSLQPCPASPAPPGRPHCADARGTPATLGGGSVFLLADFFCMGSGTECFIFAGNSLGWDNGGPSNTWA